MNKKSWRFKKKIKPTVNFQSNEFMMLQEFSLILYEFHLKYLNVVSNDIEKCIRKVSQRLTKIRKFSTKATATNSETKAKAACRPYASISSKLRTIE